MLTRDEVILTLRELKPLLEQRYRVRRISLFGSYARGDQSESSDVDILVDVDPGIGLEFVDMAEAIEERLGLRADVVPFDALKQRYHTAICEELVDI
jgi:predicted nucleotidyltransferase